MKNRRRYVAELGKLFAVLLPLLFVQLQADAQMYKWVDKEGVVHVQDYPPTSVRQPARVQTIPVYRNSPQGPGEPSPVGRRSELRKPSVELYGTSWCPYCKKASDFFRSRGIPFVEYDIEKDAQAAHRKQQLDSRRGVPLAVINGQPIHGFSTTAYERALATTAAPK